MKKIIPFKKDIIFKNNLAEVTSISLEHTLHTENENLITGEFIVSGEYKMTDTSINTEIFSYNLPFDINLDDHYLLDSVTVDIDDFYYEIINENILSVNIDVQLDNLTEKPLIESHPEIETLEEPEERKIEEMTEDSDRSIANEKEIENERCIEKEDIMEIEKSEMVLESSQSQSEAIFKEIETKTKLEIDSKEPVKSLFDNFKDESETYSTYRICIVREGDSLEMIIQKYGTTKEELQKYNDLSEIKIGDKLIIPATITSE